MKNVYSQLDLIVPSQLPVLILGETGTGKELVARLIHSRGPRAGRVFVAVNCASVAETLLEAELFGHERGAFTGADRARRGLFEQAHGGTIFLDEVGDMSPRMQAELLRVLQFGQVRRVGGNETRVDVRLIAATHRDLLERSRSGQFRQDLYFRLNVLSLKLPALRNRAEDIPLLIDALLARQTPAGRSCPSLSARATRRLAAYSWPGNVRELENVLHRLISLGIDRVDEEHLLGELPLQDVPPGGGGSLRRIEAVAIRQAIESSRGNRTEAARVLGINRKTLYRKLKLLGVDPGPP